jgi:hypothetical protein
LTVIWEEALRLRPGDTRVIGYCAVFKVRDRGIARRAKARDRVQRAAGGAPVSQNSTACEPLRSRHEAPSLATCQVRSTFLVAERAEESAAELRRTQGDDPAGVRCPANRAP